MRGDWKSEASEYRDVDRAALKKALLDLHTCPTCRVDLRPVAFAEDVWGCSECRETWHLQKGDAYTKAITGIDEKARDRLIAGLKLSQSE